MTGPGGMNVPLPPQTWKVTEAICHHEVNFGSSLIDGIRGPGPSCKDNGRQIDFLLISEGGNDVQFSKVASDCHIYLRCFASIYPTTARLSSDLSKLAGRFDSLAQDIEKRFVVSNILITEYHDPTHDMNGQFCNGLAYTLNGISQPEVSWIHRKLLTRLNQEIQASAGRDVGDGWVFVWGIASQFLNHGYCAGNEGLVVTVQDSILNQGTTPGITWFWKSTGTFHPNELGHDVFKNRLVQEMKRLMLQ